MAKETVKKKMSETAYTKTPTSSERLNGRDLRLFLMNEGGGAERAPLACAKSCQINNNTIFENSADKDSSANGVIPMRTEFDASSTNLIADAAAYVELVKLQNSKKPLYISFCVVSNPSNEAVQDVSGGKWSTKPSVGFWGKVYIESFSLNANAEGKAEYTIKFKGDGELKELTT